MRRSWSVRRRRSAGPRCPWASTGACCSPAQARPKRSTSPVLLRPAASTTCWVGERSTAVYASTSCPRSRTSWEFGSSSELRRGEEKIERDRTRRSEGPPVSPEPEATPPRCGTPASLVRGRPPRSLEPSSNASSGLYPQGAGTWCLHLAGAGTRCYHLPVPSTKPQVVVRCSVETKERWARMAYRHGLSLSAWLAEAAEARFALASPQGDPLHAVGPSERGHSTGHPEPAVALQPPSQARPEGHAKGHSTSCPAHHVKGVRCKLCGRTD